jgi:hypothetical protein
MGKQLMKRKQRSKCSRVVTACSLYKQDPFIVSPQFVTLLVKAWTKIPSHVGYSQLRTLSIINKTSDDPLQSYQRSSSNQSVNSVSEPLCHGYPQLCQPRVPQQYSCQMSDGPSKDLTFSETDDDSTALFSDLYPGLLLLLK